MKSSISLSRLAIASWLAVIPAWAFSHHSSTEYDRTTVVELEGEVVGVSWRNPHVTLELATTQGGEQTVWELEGSSVSAQRRRGLTEDLVKVGDQVRVAGFTSSRRPAHMFVNHLLLPSGQELLLRTVRAPRWSESDALGRETSIDPAKVAAAKAQGIFRVWSWGRAEPGWWFFGDTERFPLTDSAIAAAQEWNEFEDNPVLKCIAPGMPATMGNPYPIEFVQVGENIEIREEEFDVVRTIHLGAAADADVAPSNLGYSVGHWVGDSLVVETSKINWHYFNRVGVPQSEAVAVHERFTVNENAGRLDYEIAVTDPATLKEPWTWTAHWIWKPGEEVNRYECTVLE